MDTKEAKALSHIINNLIPVLNNKGIKAHLDFTNNHVMTNGIGCSGFFDDKNKILSCAVGTKDLRDWFSTFLHEYSHFEQWCEQCPAWTNSQPIDINSDQLLDEYLDGKDFDNIATVIKNIAFLEYDCEKRTTLKMASFEDIMDVNTYIQKSNAYVAFYFQMFKRRKWYTPEKAPYLNETIWKNMPTKFLEFDSYFDDYRFNHIDWETCF